MTFDQNELIVSVSQLKEFLICPRRYELHRVRGVEPAFVPVPLAFGSAFHLALGAYYSTIKRTGSAPSPEELTEVFAGAWAAAKDGPVPLREDEDVESLDKQLDRGVAMLDAFHKHAAALPLPKVLEIEFPFSVPVFDMETGVVLLEEKLAGVIDLVIEEDGHRVVVEHKSAAKKYSQDQLRFDIQPAAYAYAAKALEWGEVGLRFQVVTKAKTAAVQVENIRRDEADVTDFLSTAVGVLTAIDAGAFWPQRGWQCRSCPYAHACGARS